MTYMILYETTFQKRSRGSIAWTGCATGSESEPKFWSIFMLRFSSL